MNEGRDNELLAQVGRALRLSEPAPAQVLRQAVDAFAWRDISLSLAALETDSLVDDDGLARVRAGRPDRRMSFHCPDGRMVVSLIDGGFRLVGQVEPARSGMVELRRPTGVRTTEADQFGLFLFEQIEGGPVSIRWHPDDSSTGFDTEWVTI
jgi:hypothetical protein